VARILCLIVKMEWFWLRISRYYSLDGDSSRANFVAKSGCCYIYFQEL
jgi:hypothetical protein